MSKELVTRCDECGLIKGVVNHWWAVMGHPMQPRFFTAVDADLEDYESFRLDYCGQQCVGVVFNRWLSSGSVLKPTFVEQAQDTGEQLNDPAPRQLVDEDHPLVRSTRLDMRDPVNDMEKWEAA